MHCFSFDIETIPDVEFGRRMWDLGDLSDEDVASAMFFKQQQKSGNEFLPLHQHRVVAISVALRTADTFKVWSLGNEDSDEAEQGGPGSSTGGLIAQLYKEEGANLKLIADRSLFIESSIREVATDVHSEGAHDGSRDRLQRRDPGCESCSMTSSSTRTR